MNELIVDIIVATALMTIVALAALLLTLRDRFVKGHRKTAAQIRARFSSMLQLRNTLYLCAPGVLVMVLGMFFAIDRGRQHDSDWWQGLLFIPVGWFLVPLLARRSWKRYLDLRRFADKNDDPAFNQFSQSVGFASPHQNDLDSGR